jgi:hypothetical protein
VRRILEVTAALIAAIIFGCNAINTAEAQSSRPLQGNANPQPIKSVSSADCGCPPILTGNTSHAVVFGGTCIPPYDTPIYTKPADDGIVFGSLLEASGYVLS